MEAINFPEANLMLAEDQPEYKTLPVFLKNKRINANGYNPNLTKKDIPWEMTACFELTDEEIAEIVKTKKLWYTQLIMGRNFQPIRIETSKPPFK